MSKHRNRNKRRPATRQASSDPSASGRTISGRPATRTSATHSSLRSLLSATSANIAQLVFQANITTLKMSDFGEIMAMGTPNQRRRVLESMEEQNRLRTSFGLQLLSAGDAYENHPYTFSGISDVYELFMMDLAGACEIPATRLFGRSPQGLNATGESDLKIYYEHISLLQQTYLRPAQEKLLPVMCLSAFGYAPEDSEIVFEPIATTTPAERIQILSQFSSAIVSLCQSSLISKSSGLAEIQSLGKELGAFSHLKPAEENCFQSASRSI